MGIDWNGIVRKHGATVFGVAWRILGNAADADDIVQEVFLEVHQSARATKVDNWASFLRRVATYRALDRLRQRKPVLPVIDSTTLDNGGDPQAAAIGSELESHLRDAIRQLPKQQAVVFCMRYFEDRSYEQIAAALNISATAVATALHKARCKLKTMLIDTDEDKEK